MNPAPLRLRPDIRVRQIGPRPDPPRALARRIDQSWMKLRTEQPHLHDGTICTLEDASPSEIVVASAPYRNFAAQRVDPLLSAELGIVAVGVSGVVRIGPRILLGRRSAVMEYTKYWELVPSGALPGSTESTDPRHQLQVEFTEETGIASRHIKAVRILALIADVATRTVDICGRIDLDLDQASFAQAMESAPRLEYDEFRVLDQVGLREFRTTPNLALVPASGRLLDEFALEVWADQS